MRPLGRARARWVAVAVVALVAAATATASAAPISLTSSPVGLRTVAPPCLPSWWNAAYGYRRQITVTTGSSAVATDYSVSITLNHAALVTAGSSLASGDDVRIVALDSAACTWTELDRVLDDSSSWNTATTKLWFRLSAAIGADSSSPVTYFVYHGRPSAASPPANASNVFLFFDNFPGAALGPSWSVLRPPTTWSVSGSALNITMMPNTDFWAGANDATLFSIAAPAGDMEVQVKQSGALTQGGASTGIVAYRNDANYVANYHERFSGGCNCEVVEMTREVSDSPTSTIVTVSSNPIYLRLNKIGNDYTGFYSTNSGVSYTQYGTANTTFSLTRVGVTAFRSWTGSVNSVSLTNFRVRRLVAAEPSRHWEPRRPVLTAGAVSSRSLLPPLPRSELSPWPQRWVPTSPRDTRDERARRASPRASPPRCSSPARCSSSGHGPSEARRATSSSAVRACCRPCVPATSSSSARRATTTSVTSSPTALPQETSPMTSW